jgi:Z1 domain
MGRWFGFRGGYEDLTRIYTTAELAGWFSDLGYVEHRLREDIAVYEAQGLTPFQVGVRIWQHPTMQVTSPLKRRFASTTTISQSYELALEQTFKFPLRRLDDLAIQAEANRSSVRDLIARLGPPDNAIQESQGPVWTMVSPANVLAFLRTYRIDNEARSLSIPLICAYIERAVAAGDLVRWTVAVRGRGNEEPQLGSIDWGPGAGRIYQISRSRLGDTESVGVITGQGDEAVGLSPELQDQMKAKIQEGKSINRAARETRPPEEGLLLLFPISRYSGHELKEGGNRRRLFANPEDPRVRDLVGLALSFPRSRQPQQIEAYLQGTVDWRPVE